MSLFKTRFNYIILVCRFIFSLFFVSLFILIIYIIFNGKKSEDYVAEIVFGTIFSLIMIYFAYHFYSLIFKQSYNFEFDNGHFFIIFVLWGQRQLINLNEIKGFSTSNYPVKIWNFKSIILYFNDGRKIELPQFLYFNFNEIENELIQSSIQKLGNEKHKWKSLTSRHYEFE